MSLCTLHLLPTHLVCSMTPFDTMWYSILWLHKDQSAAIGEGQVVVSNICPPLGPPITSLLHALDFQFRKGNVRMNSVQCSYNYEMSNKRSCTSSIAFLVLATVF